MNTGTNNCTHCGSDLDMHYHIDIYGNSHPSGINYYCKTMVKGSIRGDLCLEREARQKAEAVYREALQVAQELMQHYDDCIADGFPPLSTHNWIMGDVPKKSEELKAKLKKIRADVEALNALKQ